MATKLDWQILDGEIERYSRELRIDQKRVAFFYVVLGPTLGLIDADVEDVITDGTADRGVDAFYFDERHGALTLHLFNFKYRENFEQSSKNFPSSEIDKMLGFVADFVGQKPTLIKLCNTLLVPKIKHVWQKFQSPIFSIVIHFASNGSKLIDAERSRLQLSLGQYRFASFVEHDLDSIVDQFIRRNEPQISESLQLMENQYFERTDGNIRGLIATIRATDLIELIKDPMHPSQIRREFFNENIRVYLGTKNSVNKSIVETASGGSPSDFWYLNNGITIVCDKYSFNPGIPSPKIDLRNPQIVNGGQTANALFEVGQTDQKRLLRVTLLVRIYEATRTDFRPIIAASTNNQTRIDSRDLKSNDAIQKRLELGLLQAGYYYERKANLYKDKPSEKRIDALRAGQACLAYYCYLPDKARTQSDRIFDEWYDRVFDNEVTPKRILTAFRLLQRIDERKRYVKKRILEGISRTELDEFLIEGIFHVLYVVGQFCLRDKLDLVDFDRSVLKIDEAIDLTRKCSDRYREKSFYRFFRSVDARTVLFNAVYGIQSDGDQMAFPLEIP
jgi:hypothetical protein